AATGTEFAMLEHWLGKRGLPDISIEIVHSHSDGVHSSVSLEDTAALEVIGEAAGALKGHGCSAALWACTSGSFTHGLAGAHRQVSVIAGIVDAPATSTSLALARAARVLGGFRRGAFTLS